jgi:hypothetical protein
MSVLINFFKKHEDMSEDKIKEIFNFDVNDVKITKYDW